MRDRRSMLAKLADALPRDVAGVLGALAGFALVLSFVTGFGPGVAVSLVVGAFALAIAAGVR